MKKLFLFLSFISCVVYAQKFQPSPTINIIGGALPQDSLDARVKYSDSSAVSGTASTYVTPTMSGLKANTTAVLKNADSTTLKAGLLKNSDSTTLKAGLLKNADSTTLKNGIIGLIALKANAANPSITGTFTGDASTRGQKSFGHAVAHDTLVSSAIGAGTYVFLQPVIASASDTIGFKGLWIQSVKLDTAFVIQTTSGAYVAVKYNWWIVQ
jgi:hypothetical protein